jgi:MFS family permease
MLTVAVALQAGWGMSALRTGLAIAPQGLSYLAMSLVARSLVARFGRMAITAGAVTLSAGLSLLAVLAWYDVPALRPPVLVPAMVLIGAGQGLLMVPLFGVILSAVPPRLAGAASGVLTTTQQTGLALGAGTLGTLFFALAAALGWRPATTATLSAASLLALAAAGASIRLPDSSEPTTIGGVPVVGEQL